MTYGIDISNKCFVDHLVVKSMRTICDHDVLFCFIFPNNKKTRKKIKIMILNECELNETPIFDMRYKRKIKYKK